jgi:manganese/zinc/iron transport system permease protein
MSMLAAPEATRCVTLAAMVNAASIWQQFLRVLTLQDYNTRIVVVAAALLGIAAGVVGGFTLLRKRALIGDALSHATLPGICFGFLAAVALGDSGKSLTILLLGATITGLLGVATILWISKLTRLKEDTALGAVLSVFFGAGISLLAIIQQLPQGHAAGLEAFVYGKTASMGLHDARLITAAALVSIAASMLFFREFKLLCFDDEYAQSAGYPIFVLDWLLMGLVVMVCIVGLQAVGLILIIALLVIPAAAARFWTDRMIPLVLIAAVLGGCAGILGAASSAVYPKLPSGAMVVLVCSGFFVVSMVFGRSKGVSIRWWRRVKLNRKIADQHLLRAMYEVIESRLGLPAMADQNDADELSVEVSATDLLEKRSWTERQLRKLLNRAAAKGMVSLQADDCIRLTQSGLDESEQLTRQHRLWELFLIRHADVATNRVDADADAIEHVLEPELVAELERLLAEQFPQFPASPHALPLKPATAGFEILDGGPRANI